MRQILLIEDSATAAQAARDCIAEIHPDVPVVTVGTWMRAAIQIPKSDFVIVDWILDDGITACDVGALQVLIDCGIPFVIWSGRPELVPEEWQRYVIAKTPDALRRAVKA